MKLRKTIAALTALTLTATIAVFPVSAADETAEPTVLTETEDNNTIAAANEIEVNADIQGNISEKTDKDYYKLTLEEDGKLDIAFAIPEAVTTNQSNVYWTVSIYDENGTLSKSHSVYGYAMKQHLNSMGLDAGMYYIVVAAGSYYHSDAAYTMTLSFDTEVEWESENNGTLSGADTITANTPISGNSHVKEDTDYYKLVLTEDAALDVSFSFDEFLTSSSAYWTVTLYSGENAEETIQSMNISGTTMLHQMRTVGLSAGTYYLKVLADDYYYASINYTLTATATTGTSIESEDNDTIANADALPLATAFNANIHNNTDVDYFAVELTEDAALSCKFSITDPLTTSTSDRYWVISLVDADSNVLESYNIYGNTTVTNIVPIGLDAGTYYIQVKPYSSYYWSNAPYTLTLTADMETEWEGESNDTMAAADALTLGTGMNAKLHQSADIDYFKFTLTEQSGVSFSLDPSEIVSDSASRTYWNVTLCSEDGNAVASFDVTANTIKNQFTTMGLDAGNYYIRVQKDSYHTTIQYLLTAALVEKNWEGETNDTLSTADDLDANTAINGRIHASKGKDYYKVTFDKSGKLNVSFVIEPDSSNDSEYWQLTLMNENGTSLQTMAVSGENATVTMPEYEVEAGTYYILVANDSYYYWTTQYTLTANYEADTFVLGDVNEDGAIDAVDAAEVLVAAANIGADIESGLSESQEAAADVNADGSIDATDASIILCYAVAVGSNDPNAKLEDFI